MNCQKQVTIISNRNLLSMKTAFFLKGNTRQKTQLNLEQIILISSKHKPSNERINNTIQLSPNKLIKK